MTRVAAWVPGYRPRWLRADVVAGLTVAALVVPEGMAYARLAGVPPEAAFYAAPVALLAYALLGTSRQLVVAVSGAIAVLSSATVSQVAEPGSAEFVTTTAALAVLAGLLSLVAGLLRLGRLAQFFSESVLTGFVFGLALVIAVQQLPEIVGIEDTEGNAVQRLWHLVRNLGEANGWSVAIGVATVTAMLLLERYVRRVPAALAALLGGILVGELLDVASVGVEVVGEVPAGLAGPAIPSLDPADLGVLLAGALGIALVSFAEAIGPARQFAAQHRYRIDENRELVALGAANAGAGLFQGFPVGSSLSKSAANDRAGARTPMSLVVAAAVTAVVALVATDLFASLPEATLGGIVIVAISGMMRVSALRRYWRVNRRDFAVAVTALVGVLVVDALLGLAVAVVLSLVAVIWRAATPNLSVLGREPETAEFVSLRSHPEATVLHGLVLLRLDENLFFANSRALRSRITDLVRGSDPRPDTVVLDLQATVQLDVPACDELRELAVDLRGDGVVLLLTRVHAPTRAMLAEAGTLAELGVEQVYRSNLAAVAAHAARTGRSVDADQVTSMTASGLGALADDLPAGPARARLRRAAAALNPDEGAASDRRDPPSEVRPSPPGEE